MEKTLFFCYFAKKKFFLLNIFAGDFGLTAFIQIIAFHVLFYTLKWKALFQYAVENMTAFFSSFTK